MIFKTSILEFKKFKLTLFFCFSAPVQLRICSFSKPHIKIYQIASISQRFIRFLPFWCSFWLLQIDVIDKLHAYIQTFPWCVIVCVCVCVLTAGWPPVVCSLEVKVWPRVKESGRQNLTIKDLTSLFESARRTPKQSKPHGYVS